MSSRLALLLLAPLALASCRKTESVAVPVPVDTVQAALPDTSAAAPDSGAAEASAPPEKPSYDSVLAALPPDQRDSVRIWQARIDSLRAAWERDMADEAPRKDFVKRPFDYPPPASEPEGKVFARVFRGIQECGGDSVFDVYRAGGDAEIGGLESQVFHLAPGFVLTGGVRQGMSTLEAVRALGKPYRNGDGYLSWAVQDWGEREYSNRVAWQETVRFFFRDDRLVAVWIFHPFYDC